MSMSIIKDEVVFVFVSIIAVNSLIRSTLDYTISITTNAIAFAVAFVLLVLALIVFIFHKSSIVHKSWLLNFSLLKDVLF